MKVLVIGAVGTTALTIKMLDKHQFEIVGVLGHEPANQNRVSGLKDLRSLSEDLGIDFLGFKKINDNVNLEWASSKKPEIIFAVGFSQILQDTWLSMAPMGCVGFHPTLLPNGRGRAPLAWSILEHERAAANFFLMGEGADDGPIFVQEPFDIEENDDAESVVLKLRNAIEAALDKWLPELKNGKFDPVKQDEERATYYGKREPCDSLIDWSMEAYYIDRLIKASAPPHAGAFTFFGDKIVTAWKSRINKTHPYKGVIGRILLIEGGSILVQCGSSTSLWIDKYELNDKEVSLKVGDKLGTLHQNQIDSIINNFVWKKNEK